jgi:uncharacterized protein YbjT (DUF2867 family)
VILITGATGHVGLGGGASARGGRHARSRPDPLPHNAAWIEHLGLETALRDSDQPDTLDAAMKGCDRMFLLSPQSPRQPQQEQQGHRRGHTDR